MKLAHLLSLLSRGGRQQRHALKIAYGWADGTLFGLFGKLAVLVPKRFLLVMIRGSGMGARHLLGVNDADLGA